MSQEVERLFLPFAVQAEDRTKPFTKDMEIAAVFCLAESEREKGRQLILKKPVERISFIAQMCYPIWLAPWRKRTLVFDGFEVKEHVIVLNILPDVKAFQSDIQTSAETPEAYSAALSDNLNYFQSFSGQDEKRIASLIADPEFVNHLTSYLKEAKARGEPLVKRALLSPSMSPSKISIALEELSNLRESIAEDIKDLHEGMKTVSATTKKHEEALREEIRETRQIFHEKIKTVEPRVMKRLQDTQKQCDKEITELSNKYKIQLRNLHKDYVRLEKRQQRLSAQIERCKTEIRSSKLRKDEGSEQRWRQKLQETKKELPIIKKKMEEIDKKIQEAEDSKKIEIGKIRSQYESKAEAARKDVRELEASRDASIRMKEKEVKTLHDKMEEIIDQMNILVKLKKEASKNIDELGITKKHDDNVLVYIPFYLAAYETKKKKRYAVIPPSIVGSMGVLTKFKGAFGMTRMKSFLQPRSESLAKFLDQLIPLLREDHVFEKETNDAGTQADIIGMKKSKEYIEKGLRELEKEGWISENEHTTFSQVLMKE